MMNQLREIDALLSRLKRWVSVDRGTQGLRFVLLRNADRLEMRFYSKLCRKSAERLAASEGGMVPSKE